MKKDLLLEVGTEEIPSSFLPPAINEFRRLATELLESNRLDFEAVNTMGTPRRLTLFVSGLAEAQGDLIQEVTGPPKKVAYDQEGNPTPALEKFCNRYGANPSEASFVKKAKGEYVCLKTVEQGRKAVDLLQEVLPPLILSIPFQKSMRWGDLDIRFARPIHWILALYGDNPMAFSLGDIIAAGNTRGHRFLGDPGLLRVEKAGDYPDLLRRNYVLLDPQERKKLWGHFLSIYNHIFSTTSTLLKGLYVLKVISCRVMFFSSAIFDFPTLVKKTCKNSFQTYKGQILFFLG